jgi:hypothetical protein
VARVQVTAVCMRVIFASVGFIEFIRCFYLNDEVAWNKKLCAWFIEGVELMLQGVLSLVQ